MIASADGGSSSSASVWFAAGSLLCGLSPTIGWLIAARILQGVGGALLVPGSLAIISASFVRADRARAIGAWSALAGVATAAGPLLGGWMVETIGWRWVFLINLPLAVVVLVVTLRQVPETADPSAPRSFDIAGAALGALGLAALTYALIGADDGWTLDVVAVLTLGVAALVAFVVVERRGRHPMLPMDIFESRQFSAANLVTLLVYAALGALFFLLVVQLQVVAGLGPLAAGSALLPITIIMLLLSGASGQLAERIGPRLPMTVGPLLAGVGSLLLLRVGPDTSYATDVLPAVVVIGLGLALTVAPLTATVLAAAEDRHAGIASGVNNAVARAGGLLAVAAIPVLVGLTGDAYDRPGVFDAGFDRAMIICAVLFTAGGVLSLLTIRAPLAERGGSEPGRRTDAADNRRFPPALRRGGPAAHPAQHPRGLTAPPAGRPRLAARRRSTATSGGQRGTGLMGTLGPGWMTSIRESGGRWLGLELSSPTATAWSVSSVPAAWAWSGRPATSVSIDEWR